MIRLHVRQVDNVAERRERIKSDSRRLHDWLVVILARRDDDRLRDAGRRLDQHSCCEDLQKWHVEHARHAKRQLTLHPQLESSGGRAAFHALVAQLAVAEIDEAMVDDRALVLLSSLGNLVRCVIHCCVVAIFVPNPLTRVRVQPCCFDSLTFLQRELVLHVCLLETAAQARLPRRRLCVALVLVYSVASILLAATACAARRVRDRICVVPRHRCLLVAGFSLGLAPPSPSRQDGGRGTCLALARLDGVARVLPDLGLEQPEHLPFECSDNLRSTDALQWHHLERNHRLPAESARAGHRRLRACEDLFRVHATQQVAEPHTTQPARQLGRHLSRVLGEGLFERQGHQWGTRVLRRDHDDLAHARYAEGHVGLPSPRVVESIQRHLRRRLADRLRRE
mmetsp:Transcript_7645/g.12859  ORF Transcript_7645/g.12859 Transcript_7645/m.12859 type:complete len:396 (-) Transcript_7645:971-2158(-)